MHHLCRLLPIILANVSTLLYVNIPETFLVAETERMTIIIRLLMR